MGKLLATLVQTGQMTQAYALLAPIRTKRTPIPLLRRIGEAISAGPLEPLNAFLEHIAATKTEVE